MADLSVYAKLSRILETHSFDGDVDSTLEDFIQKVSLNSNDDDSFSGRASQNKSPLPEKKFSTLGAMDTNYSSPSSSSRRGGNNPISPSPFSATAVSGAMKNADRPTPFEIWQAKQQASTIFHEKEPAKLTESQKEKKAEDMHRANKAKEGKIVREQNKGLKMELYGHEFKPRSNKLSAGLSKSMKPLLERYPGLEERKEAGLKKKREAKIEAELKKCTFTPERTCAKVSDMYLKRMGRETPVAPEDFFRYHRDKERRNDQRRQILNEMTSKELTFTPTINSKTRDIQERMLEKSTISIDPVTHTVVIPKDELEGLLPGKPYVLESEHPYNHNEDKLTPIKTLGAVAYSVTFDSLTVTEAVYDYLKFYKDTEKKATWGADKYSGGVNNTHSNWPGLQGRPPLIIAAPKFLLYFKTNGSINGWGYKMTVTPYFPAPPDASGSVSAMSNVRSIASNSDRTDGQPTIVSRAASYRDPKGRNVHVRLYQQGIERATELHNKQASLIASKLNVSIRPWEAQRSKEIPASWTQEKAYKPKATMIADDFLWQPRKNKLDKTSSDPNISGSWDDSDIPPLAVIEYEENLSAVWKFLTNSSIVSSTQATSATKAFDASYSALNLTGQSSLPYTYSPQNNSQGDEADSGNYYNL